MKSKLTLGKVSPELLQKFFALLPEDKSVIIGPKIGEDAAIVTINKEFIAVKTDPITFSFNDIGSQVVHINANDIACMGAVPRWFLVTLLLPPETDTYFLSEFFDRLTQSCSELEISIIGGHTEVTPAVNQPIAIGCMIGKVLSKKVVSNSNIQAGDAVLLTKAIAIEGTHVIYQKKRAELRKELSPCISKKIENFFKNPGISVVKEATLAFTNADIHCMHDPTEAGLLGGVWEMAVASEVGIKLYEKSIPILKETKLLCQKFNLNPLSLLASGSLLIAASAEQADKLLLIYKNANIPCAKIGEVVPKNQGIRIIKEKGEVVYIESPPEEELNKLW